MPIVWLLSTGVGVLRTVLTVFFNHTILIRHAALVQQNLGSYYLVH